MSETRGSYDGQSTIWAAIEVSGRLSQITQTDGRQNEGQGIGNSSFVDHDLGKFISTDPGRRNQTLNLVTDRFFHFGCLYDLMVDILPAAGTTVIQVLKEQIFPT